MRIWSKNILPYLPTNQFRSQLRECLIIMRKWRDTGSPHHILVNKITEYPKYIFTNYFLFYSDLYSKRYGKSIDKDIINEFNDFSMSENICESFDIDIWIETKEHLRIEMANLYEKHQGIGRTKITDQEWDILKYGYKKITGEEYVI